MVGISSVALQELVVIADRLGIGVRQALCVGELDITDAHSAIGLKNILELLNQDPDTDDIVLALPSCGREIVTELLDSDEVLR